MMRCPFCEADLGDENVRLRDGRCPRCSSILNWTADEGEPPVATAPSPSIAAPAVKVASDDDDELTIKDIVRTLVERGGQQPPAAKGKLGNVRIATPPDLRGEPSSNDRGRRPPGIVSGISIPEIDKIWRGSLTVQTHPSATLKAVASATDEAVSDLLIRPYRLREPGQPADGASEYELQEVIGEGGVGVVYAARQASIDRTVAVKMLKQDFAHKRDHRNKFLSEAVVTGELDHPNIVPIYDLGTSDVGSLFYAMKRVRGTPWSDVIRQQSLAENLRTLMSVADAIAFAHSRGVIHRDLKPENVMLGKFGEVLVMDWGIALSTNMFLKSDRISQSTSMGGTPAYMAPEMATGPLEKIGPPSDIYLLGAILYEIIAGKPPHTGKDVMSCLYAAARNEIQPTDNSGELHDIAFRAMATLPADRYATVQEFQAAVREYESHSESIILSTRAEQESVTARKSRNYEDYARALYGFQEAQNLWPGNDHARTGEINARLDYAATALEKEDYDLGVSLLDPSDPDQAPLHKKLVHAQRDRMARQARIKALRNIAFALAAAIFLVVTFGLIWIANQKREIQFQRDELQAKKTKLEETIAALDAANGQLEVRTDELGQEKVKLESTNSLLRQAKAEADAQTQTAMKAQEDEAAASYLAQIGVAAERIANNSFLDAERLLADYNSDRSPWTIFRHWEWGHLTRLCDLQAGQQQVGSRIEAFGKSADASYLAAGTAAGRAYVWEVDWPERSLTQVAVLAHRGPVRAIAMNRDGSQIAVAGDFENGAIFVYGRPPGSNVFSQAPKQLTGHPAGILSLAFSPRSDYLASSARDGTARLWDLSEGEAVQTFAGHSGPIWSIVFSPDGEQVATAGEDATVQVRRLRDPRPRSYRGHEGPVYAVAWSPQGTWIGSAGRDRNVHVWRADKNLEIDYGKIRDQLDRERGQSADTVTKGRALFHQPNFLLAGHSAEVHSLSFSDDGRYLLSGANDNTIRRWDLEKNEEAMVFRGHGGWIRGCVLGGEPRFAASGSLDGFIKLWDGEEYEEVRALKGHDDAVLWAAFSRDGKRMITAGRDRQALVWSTTSHEPILVLDEGEAASNGNGNGLTAKLKEGHEYLVTDAAFFPDQRRIVTSAGDGSARIWDASTGGQLRKLNHTGTQGVLALSPDGRWILTGSDARGAGTQQGALLWDADQAEQSPTLLAGHPAEVSAVAFSPAKETASLEIATGDVLGNVRLWRFQPGNRTLQLLSRLPGHAAGYPITAIGFTPDGRRVLTAAQDRTVMTHDVATGQPLPLVLRHSGGVKALEISRSGAVALTLCSLGKGAYRVSAWDLDSGGERSCDVNLLNESLTSITFHPDQSSAVLTSTSGKQSRFWSWDLRSESLQPFWKTGLAGTVWSATFSPSGKQLLAVGGSRARLVTANRGELEKSFSPHGPITAADFSPSGRLIATSSLDGDVKLWFADPQHPQYGRVAVKISQAHDAGQSPSGVNFVAFAPGEMDDEVSLVTAGSDGTAQVWKVAGGVVQKGQTLRGHRGRVKTASYSPDGKLIVTASDDKSARVWDAATGELAEAGGGVLSHSEPVLFASFSPDGTLAITGCDDNNAYLWDLTSPMAAAPHVLQGHTAAVTSASVSPDNRRAITGSQDGIAKVWDLTTGKEILSLKRHTAELTSVHFSPDGSSILTSSLDGTGLLWLAEKIGPSIKLSSARLDIPRVPGLHAIDPAAQILDPDSGELEGGALRAWMTSGSSSPNLELEVVRGELEVTEDKIMLVHEGGPRPLATRAPGGSGESLALQFLPGVQAQDAQRLIRAIALRLRQPLERPLVVRMQITDGAGRASNIAEAIIQSADVPGQRAEIAAAQAR